MTLDTEPAFGPVPSRRLGNSLGINSIPPKHCTYACVYCQVGRTTRMEIRRGAFYAPEATVRAAGEKLRRVEAGGTTVDYLTVVPDGEPTLDIGLGDLIDGLKELGRPVAVISNASLVTDPTVRDELSRADWVSLKVDAVDEAVWKRIDRPHGKLELPMILAGIRSFAEGFSGRLVTETMLVAGVNDAPDNLEGVAAFLGTVGPAVAYISAPTRPPAETWVRPPDEAALHRAYQIFSGALDRVELLIAYEGTDFSADEESDPAGALLGICAVHPMREDAVAAFLDRANVGWELVDRLIDRHLLITVSYKGNRFYLRRFPHRSSADR